MVQQEVKPTKREGVTLRVYASALDELPKLSKELAKIRELGFALETVTLIPELEDPLAHIICKSGC